MTRSNPEGATTPLPRPLPALDDRNRDFWTGGARGELRIMRCRSCKLYQHPPDPVCHHCQSFDLDAEAVSGHGVVHTFTINHQQWVPGWPVPYALAIVELAEQNGLRLTTNIVGCDPSDVTIGMPVQVVFEQIEDVWIPLFAPAED